MSDFKLFPWRELHVVAFVDDDPKKTRRVTDEEEKIWLLQHFRRDPMDVSSFPVHVDRRGNEILPMPDDVDWTDFPDTDDVSDGKGTPKDPSPPGDLA